MLSMVNKTVILILIIKFVNFTKSTTEINLTSGWNIRNSNGSIQLGNQILPSGVYSALEEAKLTESVLFSYNDVNLRWIAHDNWTYSIQFHEPFAVNNYTGSVLVFHGVDTNAKIYLNDRLLDPQPNNMFVRYRYNIRDFYQAGNNTLKVEFQSPIVAAKQYAEATTFTPPECPPPEYNGECHMNMLRKMQASFSWDWGLAAPSVGLWKPVTIEIYETAIIRDVTYQLEETTDSWKISVTVYLEAGVQNTNFKNIEGYLSADVVGVLDEPISKRVVWQQDVDGEFEENISFEISKDKVSRWWPNGYGNQTLYTLKCTWNGEISNVATNEIRKVPPKYLVSDKSVKIGFRTIELIEEPIANVSGLSFYFKVNGLAIFMKGTNWIPSHILPEKCENREHVKYLMKSVQDAHMNMIRVWGGGLYESDYFYDLADEYGILIWQDLMFACAMYPVFNEFLDSVHLELKQNIRRLQSHPSIAVWAGNNENEVALVQNWYGTNKERDRFSDEYKVLYGDAIFNAIHQNDKFHIWLYSSPSNGPINSKESLLQANPQDWHYGDIHYYNYLADGWNPNEYPKPRFSSEYGFQSMQSLSSWKSSMRSTDNLAELLIHRQHFPGGSEPVIILIKTHLPLPAEQPTDEYLNTLFYFSQISQAMTIKAESEIYRIEQDGLMKTMGALYWQLNDVWVAPSWSSIEYNGDYKIAHHFVKKFFAPRAIVGHVDLLNRININVVRDIVESPESFTVTLKLYTWSSLNVQFEINWPVTMTHNAVQKVDDFIINKYLKAPLTRQNTIVELTLTDHNDAVVSTDYVFLEKIKNCIDVQNPKIKTSITSNTCKSQWREIAIDIAIEYPAIFVYIQLEHSDVDRFSLSDNGFMQLQANRTISLSFVDEKCTLSFDESNIKILTVNDYMI